MLKQTIVIFVLAAVACVVMSGPPDNDKPYELEDKNGPGEGKFARMFGAHNFLEDGNGKYNLGRSSICPKATNDVQCRQCCEAAGKSSKFRSYKVILKFPTVKLGECICFTRHTL